jgi:segregation and condensation protein B
MDDQPDNLRAENGAGRSADPDRAAALEQLPEMRRLEAVLFMAREPLGSRRLAQLAHLADGTQARTLVRQLNRHYDRVGRAFNVQQVAGGFQMRTRPMFSMWLTRLSHAPPAIRLTAPALETLAVIAYRQPVPKADIEAIRGVSCGELLRQLLDRGMVRIAGRSRELGSPYLYGTTRRFLEVFGLASLDALPRASQLRGTGLPSPARPNSPENRPDTRLEPLDESASSPQNLEIVNPPDSPVDVLQQNRFQEE